MIYFHNLPSCRGTRGARVSKHPATKQSFSAACWKALGPDRPNIAKSPEDYAALPRESGRCGWSRAVYGKLSR